MLIDVWAVVLVLVLVLVEPVCGRCVVQAVNVNVWQNRAKRH